MNDLATSLLNAPNIWQSDPLAAFSAWLSMPDFVITKAGTTQPLRENSAKVYRFMGSKFIREVVLPATTGEQADHCWRSISAENIAQFLDKNNLKRGIRNRYVRLLERLFDHLTALRLTAGNPARGLAIKAPTASNQNHDRTMWLTNVQQDAVLAALPDGTGWKAQRNKALIATVLGGGVKVSEVIELTVDAIGARQEDGGLCIEVWPRGAGRRHRTKVSPTAAGILTAWISARDAFGVSGQTLFPAKLIGGHLHPATVYRKVAQVLSDAGIDPGTIKRRGARTLRNSFAVRELSDGQPLELVGEYLGHRADRSTRYYTQLLKKR